MLNDCYSKRVVIFSKFRIKIKQLKWLDKIAKIAYQGNGRKAALIFSIVDLKAEDLRRATGMAFADYEDALQNSQAMRVKADSL